MRATGRVFPAPPTGTTVYLQHWLASKWQTVGSGRTSGNGVTVNLTRPASYLSYRLVVAARYPYGAGISPTKGFANYVWRASFDRPLNGTSSGGSYSFPTPDTMYVDLPSGSSSYWLYVNTARCKRLEGVLIAVQMRGLCSN
ncbi:hypothetical protein OG394_15455 [Kribbella sp. NBC_01245]|uniref:hypothetical protein n=1 Tax=Kribbella sp. NBC_01245 TaxID=2903578 RepID=UPI002E2E2730|nr:hypothetical protein [Kribbella sp. NBC_01245]